MKNEPFPNHIIPCTIFSIFFVALLCIITFSYIDYYTYFETECYVDNIVYPININTSNLWYECKKYDYTSMNPCIKINVNTNIKNKDTNVMIHKDFLSDLDNECTFIEECISPNLDYILYYSQEIYNKYINTNITCYVNNDDNSIIYMNRSIDYSALCILSILSMITGMCSVLCYFTPN